MISRHETVVVYILKPDNPVNLVSDVSAGVIEALLEMVEPHFFISRPVQLSLTTYHVSIRICQVDKHKYNMVQ